MPPKLGTEVCLEDPGILIPGIRQSNTYFTNETSSYFTSEKFFKGGGIQCSESTEKNKYRNDLLAQLFFSGPLYAVLPLSLSSHF